MCTVAILYFETDDIEDFSPKTNVAEYCHSIEYHSIIQNLFIYLFKNTIFLKRFLKKFDYRKIYELFCYRTFL